jgi:hypothetical protein
MIVQQKNYGPRVWRARNNEAGLNVCALRRGKTNGGNRGGVIRQSRADLKWYDRSCSIVDSSGDTQGNEMG